MKLIKILLMFSSILAYNLKLNAQMTKCYIGNVTVIKLSKDDFLKEDSIRTTTKDFIVSSYTAGVTSFIDGKSIFRFRLIDGPKIDSLVKDWIKLSDSSTVFFDEILISKASNYPYEPRRCPPIAYVIK